MIQANFKETKAYQKGELGEEIVDRYLKSKGVIPYKPDADGAHPFDRLCATKDKSVFVVECKSKRARDYYPDTGIDIRHYKVYKDIQSKHNMDVFICFIDEKSATIYGNTLKNLMKTRQVETNRGVKVYPWEQGKQVYFPLLAMIHIAELNATEVERLRGLSEHKEGYEVIHG